MAERKQDDRLLNEYLRGDSALARAYRETGREEPPAHLDAAILAQARAAAAPRRGGKPRWLMPLSLVATVVLSIGVVLLMSKQGVAPEPTEVPLPAAPAVKEKPPIATPKAAPTVAPKEAPRFEPRVFTPKEMPAVKAPEQWLAEIEALRKAGMHAEADAELEKFRQRYPDYSLDKLPK